MNGGTGWWCRCDEDGWVAVVILLLLFFFFMGYDFVESRFKLSFDSWVVGFVFHLGLDLVLVLVMIEGVNLEILVWVLRWQIASV